MIQTYTALANQNIYDVCNITYGTIDNLSTGQSALFKLIQDNGFGSINNYPFAGQQFTWDDTLVFNQQSNQANSLSNTNYATAAGDL